MLDRTSESLFFTSCEIKAQSGERVLCIAPHPDDEVLGAGGYLALAARAGAEIATLILTRGEAQAQDPEGDARVRESIAAAACLGLPEPEWGPFLDREVRYCEPLIAELLKHMNRLHPSESEVQATLLAPSLSEPHPDHQAVALAALAAVQRAASGWRVLFYEVGAPFTPNAWLDISEVESQKWAAIAEYRTQEAVQPYLGHAQALAKLRAFGRGRPVSSAEAFFAVSAADLQARGPAAALPGWPHRRTEMLVANVPSQLPLVSVIVRSVDRPELAQAVASVAAQTYPNLEVVVVNASGRPHSAVLSPTPTLVVRVADPERDGLSEDSQTGARNDKRENADRAAYSQRPSLSPTYQSTPLGRSAAANLGLSSARGELVMFLDDDDLIAETHVAGLVSHLTARPKAIAAYSGVRVESAQGDLVRNYNVPWSRIRLKGINYLPIHGVLFRLAVVQENDLRFDESLPVLEDWDFWRRLADLGDFVHRDAVTAIYRQSLGESQLGDPQHPNHWRTWHKKILRQSIVGLDEEALTDWLAEHAVLLDAAQSEMERGLADLAKSNAALDRANGVISAHVAVIDALRQNVRDEQTRAHISLQQATDALTELTSRYDRAFEDMLAGQNRLRMEELAARDTAYGLELQDAARRHAEARDKDRTDLNSEWQSRWDQQSAEQAAADAHMQMRVQQLQQQLSQALAHESTLKHELNGVYRSRSWRITQPIRTFRTLFR